MSITEGGFATEAENVSKQRHSSLFEGRDLSRQNTNYLQIKKRQYWLGLNTYNSISIVILIR
ncbi:hypothetical protein PTUN_b0352 [Pseudoalteromonas tunicata]|nr:hypothetical protein PTUN_b0352 [Pseudoalteromonas tunicata]